MIRYKIADVVFDAEFKYGYTSHLCRNYVYSGEEAPELKIVTEQKDIDAEKEHEGGEKFPDYYLESLAVFRKLCDYLLTCRRGIIFHSTALAVDGKAYLFTAPSGTGKSTHARLWREMLGDKVIMINDDKPIIRYIDDGFYVYGTPWNGKHGLDTNCRVKLQAICALTRGKVNKIYPISPAEMLMVAMNQTLRPEDPGQMDELLTILDKLLLSVRLYRLECDISEEAARISYGAMVKNEIGKGENT